MTTIRTCSVLLVIAVLACSASAEVIYRGEEEDGSITFTHYGDRDSLEIFIDDELAARPATMAAIDPATVYANIDAYDALILDAAARHQVSPALIKAVMLVESGFNPTARSPKGAMGLMQLMPGTAAELGVTDAFDPAQAIAGGTHYLRKMLDRFGGDRIKATAAYNAGPGRVAQYDGIPPFEETQFYVRNVDRFFDYFSDDRPVWGSQ